ncbi:hypothetical protein CDL15_Pgr022139 [Punica granatum]|uniref:Uncharacterized protein n=1 Tax=Punica granatum TaxID=22663 RepID=A0A218VS68_PUNGR|nr:hypothetical protein CDL15_Pgr022139 [Punica granatum]PKI70676.1 hypothetical protein CRG98_008909 [Punica granatum]
MAGSKLNVFRRKSNEGQYPSIRRAIHRFSGTKAVSSSNQLYMEAVSASGQLYMEAVSASVPRIRSATSPQFESATKSLLGSTASPSATATE